MDAKLGSYKQLTITMTKRAFGLFALGTALGAALAPPSLHAQTYFVSDELTVPLRSGPSRDHRIITFLKSGTVVMGTESADDTEEWRQVQTSNKTGWLMLPHVQTSPTAKIQLKTAQAEILKLKTDQTEKNKALNDAQAQIVALQESLKRARGKLQNTREKLTDLESLSADTLAVNNRNTALTEKLSLLEVQQQQLSMENRDLRNNQKQQGMIQGALAVIAGALLAVVLPRLTRKKQRSNWI